MNRQTCFSVNSRKLFIYNNNLFIQYIFQGVYSSHKNVINKYYVTM